MKLSKPLVIIVYTFLTVLTIAYVPAISSLEYRYWLVYVGWFIVFHWLVSLYCLHKARVKLFGLSGFFVILSYVFHLGQVVVKVVAPSYRFSIVDYSQWVSPDLFQESTVFSLLIINMVILGMLASAPRRGQKDVKVREEPDVVYRCMGWVILTLTAPIRMLIDGMAIVLSMREGYLSVYEMGFSGVLHQLASFYVIGVFFLLVGYKGMPKRARTVLMVSILYNIIAMLPGGRSRPTISILLLVYFYFTIVRRLRTRTIVLGLFLGYASLTLLNSIQVLRAEGIPSMTALLAEAISSDNSPILMALEEFGGTIYTVYRSILTVPGLKPFSYGATYIYGLAPILPNINGVFTNINDVSIFAKHIGGYNLGGSYIGELYYNFGYFSVFIAIMLGIFVNHLSKSMELYIERKDYYLLSFYVMLSFNIIWWVRSSFTDLTRSFVWSFVLIRLVYVAVHSAVKMKKGSSILGT